MKATLVAVDDVPDIRVDKPIILIGRNDDCDVVVDSKKVSRQHCCIAQIDDHLVVRDLGSTNGIRVNGQRITESRLQAGDEFSIAHLRFRVHTVFDNGPPKPQRAQVTDSQLEEAEEPVPLSDIDVDDRANRPENRHDPDNPDFCHTQREQEQSKEKPSGWLELPDNADLAPASDMDIHRTPSPE